MRPMVQKGLMMNFNIRGLIAGCIGGKKGAIICQPQTNVLAKGITCSDQITGHWT